MKRINYLFEKYLKDSSSKSEYNELCNLLAKKPKALKRYFPNWAFTAKATGGDYLGSLQFQKDLKSYSKRNRSLLLKKINSRKKMDLIIALFGSPPVVAAIILLLIFCAMFLMKAFKENSSMAIDKVKCGHDLHNPKNFPPYTIPGGGKSD